VEWHYSMGVKNNGSAGWSRLFDFGADGGAINGVRVNILIGLASNLSLHVEGDESSNITSTSYSDNNWYFLVWNLTYSSAGKCTWDVYINGNNNIYTSSNRNYPSAITRSSNYIGKSNWSGDTYFTGSIDDFRMYNRVLTTSEITSLYNYSSTYSTNYIISSNNYLTNTSPQTNVVGNVTIGTLSPGTLYTYTVTLKNGNNVSTSLVSRDHYTYSNVYNTSLTANTTANAITVGYTIPTKSGIYLYRNTTNSISTAIKVYSNTTLTATTATSYTVSDPSGTIVPNSTYNYWALPINGNGDVDSSSNSTYIGSIYTRAFGAQNTVTNINENYVTLNWNG